MKVFPYGRQLSLTLPLLLLKAQRGRAQALGGIIGGLAIEGDSLSFVCPTGEVIGEVLFASYGTPTGGLPNYAVGWCDAAPSVDVVHSSCLGNNACDVPADSTIFGDPCFGTTKELAVAVQCVNENVIGGSVSEGSMLRLTCPTDRIIGDIAFASFGTPTGEFLDFSPGACNEPTSAATVATLCTGQNSCDLDAYTGVFGDPCPAEEKYLSVQVNCVGANTVHDTVQEGSELELACPAGSSITSIIFASYGTPNNYVQGACEAVTSLEVVTESCVGQPSCHVTASDDVFGDPCPGTFKSLSVQAECSAGLAPGIIQATATGGNAVVLSCPQGETISNIGFASYGTPTNYESSSWCDAPSSETVVAAACIGKSYCSVEASTSVFGDPCPDTAKNLNVQAQCSDANWIGGSVAEGASLALACPANQNIVSIEYASYGTPAGTYPNFVSTWCDAPDSATQAAAICVGHNACTLDANSGVFTDACPGVAKRLSVIAECVDADLVGSSALDGASATIQCPQGEYIGSIPFASYGTPTGEFPDYAADPTCDAAGAVATIGDRCIGENSCSVDVHSETFGDDPCPGATKKLDVTAKCVPNNIIGTSVAQDSSASLQCPAGTYISAIDFASFGTATGIFPDFSVDPTCHAADSNFVVGSSCLGKNSCTVAATADTFTAGPCAGSTKSLSIVAECISNDIIGTSVPQGAVLHLSCPAGKTVQSIDFASFGNPTGHVGSFATGSCDDPSSVAIVQQACLGQDSCSVPANNVFTDNCYGVQKHLTVQATCATPPPDPQIIGGSVPEHGTLELSCPAGQAIDAVLYASYGLSGGAFPRFVNDWCTSPYSEPVVEFLCLGQTSCSVPAESAAFSNPCVDTDKTLSVTAHCKDAAPVIVTPPNPDPTIISATATDGNTLSLQCPNNFVVGPVLFASYGTSAVQSGVNTVSWCHAPLSGPAVQDACTGQNACSIDVSPQAPYFGQDPCLGVEKHLTVQVQCVDPDLIGGVAADGSSLDLACPAGDVVGEILFASYGNPTGDASLFQKGWCDSMYSTNVVSSLCLNQASCSIPVNTGAFSDPCVNTAKSLAVKAKCWPAPVPTPDPNLIGGSVDEHETLTLQCPTAGYIIGSVEFASFGTPTGDSPTTFAVGACDAQPSVPVVTALCVGQAVCEILAETPSFGDPCVGTDKTLSVAVECIPSDIVSDTATEGSEVDLQCPAGQEISSILFASYGTPTGSFPDFAASWWCDRDGVFDYVDLACVGLNSCSVLASSTVFGDPCSGILKSLSVAAACSPIPTPAPTPAPTPEPTPEPTPTPTPTSNSQSGSSSATPSPSGSNTGSGSGTTTPTPTTPTPSTPAPTTFSESIFVVGGSATEGSELRLICPPGKKLGSIVFASYGTPTGLLLNYETSACDALTSREIVATMCIGQPSCLLSATNGVFGNPCPGVYKSLSVEAQCVGDTDSLIGGTVPEGQALTLSCPEGQKISLVSFASYGTPSGTLGTFATVPTCDALSSVGVVEQLCIDEASCTVHADSGVFGDPCVGEDKTLSIAVQCANSYARRLRK